MANAFAANYGYRKYRGFTSNDAVLTNYQHWITGYQTTGTDEDEKVYLGTHVEDDFDDFRVATIGNTFVDEWKEKSTSGTSADKWFEIPEVYSSVATGNVASGQKDAALTDASGLAADDWCVIKDAGDLVGELFQIDSIATNNITSKTNFSKAYTTADSCTVALAYYIYYGYASESDNSSIGGTFIVGDDFERGSDGDDVGLNSDWTTISGTCELDTAIKFGGSKSVKLVGAASRAICTIPVTPSDNIAIRLGYYKEGASSLYFLYGDGTWCLTTRFESDEDWKMFNGVSYIDTGYNCKANSWGQLELYNFNWAAQTVDGNLDGNIKTGMDFSRELASLADVFTLYGDDDSGQDSWIDNPIVRNLVSVEIAGVAFGAEEEPPPDTSNTPDSQAWGTVNVGTTTNTSINSFTITNNGSACTITIQGGDFAGGDDTWDLSDTAEPGENIYGLKAGLDDDDDLFDIIVKEAATYNTLVAGLAGSATQDWGLKLYMPTSVTNYDNQVMTAIVTLVATLD